MTGAIAMRADAVAGAGVAGGGANAVAAGAEAFDPSRLLLVSHPATAIAAMQIAAKAAILLVLVVAAAVSMVVTMTSPCPH